jgi:hypothetical protein
MSSGGRGSPMLDFTQGVAPVMVIVYSNIQGVVDPRDGHCLL